MVYVYNNYIMTNNTFAERLKEIRIKKKLSQTRIGTALGVSRYPVMEWEKGKKFPDLAQLWKVAELLEVSPAYLIGETNNPESYSMPVCEANVCTSEEPKCSEIVKIPVLSGSLSDFCGEALPLPPDNNEDPDDYFVLPTSLLGKVSQDAQHKPFSLKTDGDNMEFAGIRDGDYVIVNPEEPVYDGDAAVVVYGAMANCAVRRVYWLRDKEGKVGVRLRSADATGWQQDFTPNDIKNNIVMIMGKVVFAGSRPIKG